MTEFRGARGAGAWNPLARAPTAASGGMDARLAAKAAGFSPGPSSPDQGRAAEASAHVRDDDLQRAARHAIRDSRNPS